RSTLRALAAPAPGNGATYPAARGRDRRRLRRAALRSSPNSRIVRSLEPRKRYDPEDPLSRPGGAEQAFGGVGGRGGGCRPARIGDELPPGEEAHRRQQGERGEKAHQE